VGQVGSFILRQKASFCGKAGKKQYGMTILAAAAAGVYLMQAA
jgi:hypothetical protein